MADVASIVLHGILKDPNTALELLPKLKVQFFNSDHCEIYKAIVKYYNSYQKIPSFEDLRIINREQVLDTKVAALQLLEIDSEIDLSIAIEALSDQFTQEECLDQLSSYVGKLETYGSEEAKIKLAEVVQHLEEQTNTSEEICLMSDIILFDEEELLSRIPLGINNTFDADTGGLGLNELIMLGGSRGSGKTVVACNIAANQFEQGNSCLFFSIEMRFREIFTRFMSILSGVSHTNIKLGRCSKEELSEVAKARASMFKDSDNILKEFASHGNYNKLELDLISKKQLTNNQIITVDNQGLTLADIDLNIQKFKMQHGDRLKTVVVDYVNQIVTNDLYDWKSQIMLSKKLKDLAVKHNVLMITPYQTDKSGEARFAKGLLDAADVAISLTNKGDYIEFDSTKTRGIPSFLFNAPCDWNSLKISPTDALVPEDVEEKPKSLPTKTENVEDIPWKG